MKNSCATRLTTTAKIHPRGPATAQALLACNRPVKPMIRAMILDPQTIMATLAGIFLIAFMKGGFGGGFAIIGTLAKPVPWRLLATGTAPVLKLMVIGVTAIPVGV